MPTFTVQEIINRAKAAADMQEDFVTLPQWLYWATVEHRSLSVRLAQLGYVLMESSVDLTITGAEAYDLVEPLAIIGVYEVTVNNLLRRVQAVNPFDAHRQVSNTIIGPARQWSARRDDTTSSNTVKLSLFPNPTSGIYRVYYIAHPPTLTDIAAEIVYPLGWEDRIVLGLARRALAKEESSTQDIDEQIRQCDSDVEAGAWSRLLGDAPAIRNVDPVQRGWLSPYPYPWPPVSQWLFI